MRVRRKDEFSLYGNNRKNIRKRNRRYVLLMVIEMNSSGEDAVLDLRRTVTLAKVILAVWLGAFQSPSVELRNLCPWDPQTRDYTGISQHNALQKNVRSPNKN
jgi:hypothetical protein